MNTGRNKDRSGVKARLKDVAASLLNWRLSESRSVGSDR